MIIGCGASLTQQHVERLAGRGERPEVVFGAGARHQKALDPTAVAVERARTERLERVAGRVARAEAAEVELDEGNVVGEDGDGKESHVCEGRRQPLERGRLDVHRCWRSPHHGRTELSRSDMCEKVNVILRSITVNTYEVTYVNSRREQLMRTRPDSRESVRTRGEVLARDAEPSWPQ